MVRHRLQKRDQRKAFTLVELMVVISIIGLLTSLTFPVLKNARVKAQVVRAASDGSLLRDALQLYYRDNASWPPAEATQATFYGSNIGGGWDTLGGYLKPYFDTMPYPPFPTIGDQNNMAQGYAYARGTATQAVLTTLYNGVTGQFVGCILMHDGYYMDFLMPEQSTATKNDGGLDPDGIDFFEGNYKIFYTQAECHF